MKLRKMLYNTSRNLNKVASFLGDVEAIASGNPKKIVKRTRNKATSKTVYKIANKINKTLNK